MDRGITRAKASRVSFFRCKSLFIKKYPIATSSKPPSSVLPVEGGK
jgi:hypothetical protein